MDFERITDTEYQDLTRDCEVLKTRRHKPVIMKTSDGRIIKHIYYRKGWSSSRIWPYANRFIKNSRRLTERGFIVPIVERAIRSPELDCDILVYPMIDGDSVRKAWRDGNTQPLNELPTFLTALHDAGVYFRDLHLENIISLNTTPPTQAIKQQYALIDLASAQCKRKPLNASYRSRNLKHLINENEDSVILNEYGLDKFLQQYYST